MFSATGGSSSSAKVSRAASASASLSSRAVTALRSAGSSTGASASPRRRVVVQFHRTWRPAAWHPDQNPVHRPVRSLRGGGQRVVLCCRHAIVRRTCHQGGRHGFCLQQAVQIIRQLGQIGRGAVLAGRFILYRRRRQAGFQRGQMGFNLLAIALGQVGRYPSPPEARLPGRWIRGWQTG